MGTLKSGLRVVQGSLRALQLLSAAVVLGVYAYFLAVLGSHSLDIPSVVRTIAIMAATSMVFVLIASIILRCIPGLVFTSFLIMVCDIGFASCFIYVAVVNRAGVRPCVGPISTPLGSGDSNSLAGAGPGSLSPSGAPSLHRVCKLLTVCFAAAMILLVLHLSSMLVELAIGRRRHREKRFGPSGQSPDEKDLPPSQSFAGLRKWFKPRSESAAVGDQLPVHVGPSDIVQVGQVTEFGPDGESQSTAEPRPRSPPSPREIYVETQPTPSNRWTSVSSSRPGSRPYPRPTTFPVNSGQSLRYTVLPPADIATAGGFQIPYHSGSDPNLMYPPQPPTAPSDPRIYSYPGSDGAGPALSRSSSFRSNPSYGPSADTSVEYSYGPWVNHRPYTYSVNMYPQPVRAAPDSFPRPPLPPHDAYLEASPWRAPEMFQRQDRQSLPQTSFPFPYAGASMPPRFYTDPGPPGLRQQNPAGQPPAHPPRHPSLSRQGSLAAVPALTADSLPPPNPGYPQNLPYLDVGPLDADRVAHATFPGEQGSQPGPMNAHLPNYAYY